MMVLAEMKAIPSDVYIMRALRERKVIIRKKKSWTKKNKKKTTPKKKKHCIV